MRKYRISLFDIVWHVFEVFFLSILCIGILFLIVMICINYKQFNILSLFTLVFFLVLLYGLGYLLFFLLRRTIHTIIIYEDNRMGFCNFLKTIIVRPEEIAYADIFIDRGIINRFEFVMLHYNSEGSDLSIHFAFKGLKKKRDQLSKFDANNKVGIIIQFIIEHNPQFKIRSIFNYQWWHLEDITNKCL